MNLAVVTTKFGMNLVVCCYQKRKSPEFTLYFTGKSPEFTLYFTGKSPDYLYKQAELSTFAIK